MNEFMERELEFQMRLATIPLGVAIASVTECMRIVEDRSATRDAQVPWAEVYADRRWDELLEARNVYLGRLYDCAWPRLMR